MTTVPIPSPDPPAAKICQNGAVVSLPTGGEVCLESKDAIVNLSELRGVSIRDITQVESHAIHTVAGSRSHVVIFSNGGVLQYAYNAAGEVIELSSELLRMRLTPENDLVFDFE